MKRDFDKYGLSNDFSYKSLLEHNTGENGDSISGGQKAKIELARALYYNKKLILAAKAAGKSLQAFLKKMGKKWWESQTQNWYFPIKVNWKVITGIADFAANSGGTIEDAIVKYITSHNIASKKISTVVAKTIVFIAF